MRVGKADTLRVKAIDACLVNDELHLAEFRVKYLEGLVSRHYFFEASVTHSGRAKPLHFTNTDLATHPLVEIVQIPVPQAVLDIGSRWATEEYCRDWAMWYVSFRHSDKPVLLADIDEIPSRSQIEEAISLSAIHPIIQLPLEVSYRYTNWRSKMVWREAKVFRGNHARPGVRFVWGRPTQAEMGAHLRYVGYDVKKVRAKHRDFAHEEFDSEASLVPKILSLCDEYLLCHLPRFDMGESGLLYCQAVEGLGSVQAEFAREFPNWVKTSTVAASPLQRRVLFYLLSRALTKGGASQGFLGNLSVNTAPPGSLLWSQAILMIFLQWTGLPRLMRVTSRIFSGRNQGKPGRTFWHRIRGVYRYGDQMGLEETFRRLFSLRDYRLKASNASSQPEEFRQMGART